MSTVTLHPMRFASGLLLTALLFGHVPITFAQSTNPPVITRATVNTDFNAITVELSALMQKGYIQYERWGKGNGYDYSSMQYRADNKNVVVLRGIRTGFAQSGTSGMQTITLRPCSERSDRSAFCGPQYPLTIDLKGSSSFTDVPDTHPHAQAIRFVQQQEIVAGYNDGTFKPDFVINRAEFTKIITLSLFGQTMVDQCGTYYAFTDVPRDAWYGKFICRARDGWLLTGYPDGSFGPARPILFTEAAKILANGFGLIQRTDHCNGKLCPDTDTPEHPWYEQYVRALAEKKAIPVSIAAFAQPITRGEMAEMIWRLKTGMTNLPSQSYGILTGVPDSIYENLRDGYRIDRPIGWTVQENTAMAGSYKRVFDNVFGAKIIAPQASQSYVFIGIVSCPDNATVTWFIPSNDTPKTTTIDGRTFSVTSIGDGAAGSVGEENYYATRINATQCIMLASHYFHSTGEALDEPMRSQVKAQNAQMNQTLSGIVQSVHVIGQ